jgi:glutamate/tyrosine decarboxylase-like PLP-dependent enzyme
MEHWKDDGFLGDDPSRALNELKSSFNEHVLPFLVDWWSSPRPIPTEAEIAAIRGAIEERQKSMKLPPAYEKLPDLLSILAQGMRFNRRNYVNIHPAPFVPSALASFVVALQNSNNIVEEVSKATWELERDSIEWMAESLFGIPKGGGAWGNIVSGGTIANMTALLVARDYTYDKLSRPRPARIGPRGVIDQRPGVVLGTAGTHYSIEKALWFLGLGHENLVRVPVCWDERMKLHRFKDDRFIQGVQGEWRTILRKALEHDRSLGERELAAFYAGEQCPFGLQPLDSEILKTLYSCFEFGVPLIACVLTLGTTDTGTIERVDSFAIEQLRKEDVFIHVDGASGGFAFLSEHVKPQLNHLEKIDSFTVDAHKMGFLHYPCGAVIFRDKGFKEQIYHEAPYLGPLAPTLEGSRAGSSSAALWLAKETIGAEGYKAAVNHLLEFTRHLIKAFHANGKYQVLHKVNLNAVAVAPLPQKYETRETINKMVNNIRERVVNEGEFLINLDHHLSGVKVLNNPEGTTDKDRMILDIEALRIVITNPLVKLEDAYRLVDILARYLDEERDSVAPLSNGI